MGWPGYVVGEVGGVYGGEGLGVHQEEVRLLPSTIKPNSDEDTIILTSAISRQKHLDFTLDTWTKMCSLWIDPYITAEYVLVACVGWVKNAQIRERDPDRFSATLRAHPGIDYLWE